jgi:hypothetical protein
MREVGKSGMTGLGGKIVPALFLTVEATLVTIFGRPGS